MARFIFISLLSLLLFTTANDSYAQQRRKVKGCVTHVVNYGENLLSVIERYGVTLDDLKEYNSISDDVSAGDMLYIPRKRIGKADVNELAEDIAELKAKYSPEPESEEIADDDAPKTKLVERIENRQHIVKAGETYYSISKQYEVSVEDIEAANPDIYQNDISIGTAINVPIKVIEEVVEGGIMDQESANFENIPNRTSYRFNQYNNAFKVSLLLPLVNESRQSKQFTEFYQGFLIGLDSLKNEGVSAEVNVINVEKDSKYLDHILNSGELDGSDIIFGPIYSDQVGKVAERYQMQGIPVVSPLAAVDSSAPNIFQVSPGESQKYDKLRSYFIGKKVVVFTTDNDDRELIDVISTFEKDSMFVEVFDNKKNADAYALEIGDAANVVYVCAAQDEMVADAIISKIRMIRMFANYKNVSTVASSKTARMTNIDPAVLFSANVLYVTSYHADRINPEVKYFDNRYIRQFGSTPSLYSYRGYDVALFFLGSLKEFEEDFNEYIEDYHTTILQVTYRFNRENGTGKMVNEEWMLVNYTPEYEIISR
ncbi:MAG: LysM peptidoglycan-binding domain-containing protein [Rikenellaceae bacterium]